MNIIDHGKWTLYPAPPELLEKLKLKPEQGIIFSRRDDTGEDWYEYRKKFTRGTLLATIHPHEGELLVAAVNADASGVFPANDYLIEIEGYAGGDAQAELSGKVFDLRAKTFTPSKVVPLKDNPEIEELRKELAELRSRA